MKKLTLKELFSAAALLGMFATAPFMAYAANPGTPIIQIDENGTIQGTGAEVVDVSPGYMAAVTHFNGFLTPAWSWQLSPTATTTIIVNRSRNATTTDVQNGDTINIVGTLQSFGRWSDAFVMPTTIVDVTSSANPAGNLPGFLKNMWKNKGNNGNSVRGGDNAPRLQVYEDRTLQVSGAEVVDTAHELIAIVRFSNDTRATLSLSTTTETSNLQVGDIINVTGILHGIGKFGVLNATTTSVTKIGTTGTSQ